MADDKTTLVTNSDSSGWAVAVVILLIVIAGGIYYWANANRAAPAETQNSDDSNIEIDVSLPDSNTGSSTKP